MQHVQGITNIRKTKIFLQIKKGPAGMEIFGSKKIQVIGKTGIMVTMIWSPFTFVLRNYLKYYAVYLLVYGSFHPNHLP
jgi:hypothetical protein